MILPRWTAEEDAELIRHVDPTWPNGDFVAVLKHPASRVAAHLTRRFKRRFTKNAVLSRLRRLNPTAMRETRP